MSSTSETRHPVAKGYHVADEAAKKAAVGIYMGPLLVAEDCEPLTTQSLLPHHSSRQSISSREGCLDKMKGHKKHSRRSPEGFVDK